VTTSDFTDEIPQRAFIDAQVLQLAVASDHIRHSLEAVSRQYNLEGYRLLGPAHAAGLLYCLIVVPRELWWSPELLARIEVHNPLAFFSFSATPESVEQLIRHLRNAVAHADFSVSSSGTFTFYDRRTRGETPRFVATIELPQLQVFLSVVGTEMANARDRSPNPNKT
jgi:hypothetical protein